MPVDPNKPVQGVGGTRKATGRGRVESGQPPSEQDQVVRGTGAGLQTGQAGRARQRSKTRTPDFGEDTSRSLDEILKAAGVKAEEAEAAPPPPGQPGSGEPSPDDAIRMAGHAASFLQQQGMNVSPQQILGAMQETMQKGEQDLIGGMAKRLGVDPAALGQSLVQAQMKVEAEKSQSGSPPQAGSAATGAPGEAPESSTTAGLNLPGFQPELSFTHQLGKALNRNPEDLQELCANGVVQKRIAGGNIDPIVAQAAPFIGMEPLALSSALTAAIGALRGTNPTLDPSRAGEVISTAAATLGKDPLLVRQALAEALFATATANPQAVEDIFGTMPAALGLPNQDVFNGAIQLAALNVQKAMATAVPPDDVLARIAAATGKSLNDVKAAYVQAQGVARANPGTTIHAEAEKLLGLQPGAFQNALHPAPGMAGPGMPGPGGGGSTIPFLGGANPGGNWQQNLLNMFQKTGINVPPEILEGQQQMMNQLYMYNLMQMGIQTQRIGLNQYIQMLNTVWEMNLSVMENQNLRMNMMNNAYEKMWQLNIQTSKNIFDTNMKTSMEWYKSLGPTQ